MHKSKVGFLVYTCPTHKNAKVETGENWVNSENIEKVKKVLLKTNIDLYDFKEIFSRHYEFDSVEKTIYSENLDMLFIYIVTWSWADQIAQFIRNINIPVFLYAMDDSKAWSIGGLGAIHGGLDELGIKHKIAYGNIGDKENINSVIDFAKAAKVKNVLKRSKFGAIGGTGMGILTGIVDANQWLREFGILTGFIDQYSIIVEAEKVQKNDVENYYKELKKEYKSIPEFNSIFEKSIRFYIAIEKVIKEERFNFTGLKCSFDISDNYCSGCLAQSSLSKRGFVSACLNDANGALSTYILSIINDNEPLFTADVNLLNKKDNTIKLVDDGTASPYLTNNPKEDAELHFQPTIESKASGICTKLLAKPGIISLMKMVRIQGKYVMHITEGEALSVPETEIKPFFEKCGYPNWPHALIKIKGDPDKFIQNLRSEYINMSYGNLIGCLKDICYLYDIEALENY
jgi:L-fucose/D-arabinose isomerase